MGADVALVMVDPPVERVDRRATAEPAEGVMTTNRLDHEIATEVIAVVAVVGMIMADTRNGDPQDPAVEKDEPLMLLNGTQP